MYRPLHRQDYLHKSTTKSSDKRSPNASPVAGVSPALSNSAVSVAAEQMLKN
jgi:hypothetical protein